ncbi:MAG: PD-(D/E)XK nuclease domain-containing protein, partial [Halanaerobiales bacterium]
LLKYYDLEDYQDKVREWYNGYLFAGDRIIYNPWSILSFIKGDDYQTKAYWVNTGDTSLIKRCLQLDQIKSKYYLERLYQGETLEIEVEENIIYEDVFNNVDKALSYLLHSGYLKAQRIDGEGNKYLLSIPNKEVATIYQNILKNWFTTDQKTNPFIQDLIEHLLLKDFSKFENDLASLLLTVSSYYDAGSVNAQLKKTKDRKEVERYENFYHGLILGLLVNISDEYYIESNKEYGLGKPDIFILPKDSSRTAFIMEFKNVFTSDSKLTEESAKESLVQIDEKKYAEALKKRGFAEVLKLGLGFKGKELKLVF